MESREHFVKQEAKYESHDLPESQKSLSKAIFCPTIMTHSGLKCSL